MSRSSVPPRTLLLLALLALLQGGQAQAGPLAEGCLRQSPAQDLDAVAPDAKGRFISVVVRPGLARTIDLPTEGLRQARRDMLAGTRVADADLRALADRRDGLAAQCYVRRLLAAEPLGGDSDIAFYATVAIATGRVWTLPDAVAAMRRLDPATEPPERVQAYMAMLYAHAWAGNSVALEAMIDLNGEGRLFGPLSEATRQRILDQGDLAGDGRAALRMAIGLMREGAMTPAREAQARDALGRALAGGDLEARATAINLLRLLPGAAGAPAS